MDKAQRRKEGSKKSFSDDFFAEFSFNLFNYNQNRREGQGLEGTRIQREIS